MNRKVPAELNTFEATIVSKFMRIRIAAQSRIFFVSNNVPSIVLITSARFNICGTHLDTLVYLFLCISSYPAVVKLLSDKVEYIVPVAYVALLREVYTSRLEQEPSTGRMCPLLGTKKAPSPHQMQMANDTVNPIVTLYNKILQGSFNLMGQWRFFLFGY